MSAVRRMTALAESLGIGAVSFAATAALILVATGGTAPIA
jgi:hypothetical protein